MLHTVSKNFARRAVSASSVPSALCQLDLCRVHSGDPTCPKSKDTIAPTQSAKAISAGGNLRILCKLVYEGSVRNSAESYAVHRTEVRDQASHPNGIVKVIDIWNIAGNAMLLMIPELEMRAAD